MDNDRSSKKSSKSNRDSNNMRPEKDHKSRSGSSGDKHHHKSSRPKQQTAQTADRDEAGYESQYSNPGSWNPSGLTDKQHRKKAREREERRQYAIQHPGVTYPKNGHRSSPRPGTTAVLPPATRHRWRRRKRRFIQQLCSWLIILRSPHRYLVSQLADLRCLWSNDALFRPLSF
ncbi:hypothetical protein K456DRAFT_477493 [Colletotrichum gloeosporioides 23]|nr:hypothetical protein K456DRAFT_477493 [Colletotrichum gloeosporioides 23]